MLLKDLAEKLGCRLEGDGHLEIRRVAGLDQAGPGDVTFFTNPKYAAALRRTRATAALKRCSIAAMRPVPAGASAFSEASSATCSQYNSYRSAPTGMR